jgi:hypothetical protein
MISNVPELEERELEAIEADGAREKRATAGISGPVSIQ